MRKILYIQTGVGFVHVNRNVIAQLKKHFPGHEIELYDVVPPIKKNIGVLLTNALYVLKEYATDFLFGRKSVSNFKYYFLGTTYIFRYMSDLVAQKCRNEKYDFIVQSQCLCDSSGNGIPTYIYTDHTTLNNLNYRFIHPEKFMRSKAYIGLEKHALEKADLVFVMSENIRQSLIKQYHIPESRVRLAYVGSNTDMPRSISKEKYKNKNVIFVGKEWDRKGGPLLVEAFRKVLKQIPDATLTIVGCSPSVDVPNCTIIGEVSLQEVAKHYDRASVFCLPTRREPFGIVFIEAMFNRLPIVTNNMGAAPYLVSDHNGFLLENNVEDYCTALVALLSNPGLCEEFGEESYKIASEFYTWTNVGNQIAKGIRGEKKMEETVLSPVANPMN